MYNVYNFMMLSNILVASVKIQARRIVTVDIEDLFPYLALCTEQLTSEHRDCKGKNTTFQMLNNNQKTCEEGTGKGNCRGEVSFMKCPEACQQNCKGLSRHACKGFAIFCLLRTYFSPSEILDSESVTTSPLIIHATPSCSYDHQVLQVPQAFSHAPCLA